MDRLELTPKQAEYVRNATHRWNFAVGAVRSGKSHIAISYVIPEGVLSRHGKKGINLLVGVTRETIERNVLVPMRDMWGNSMVSEINGRNIVTLFGEKCYCIGAEDKAQVSKIRGSEVKFCYVDEIADIHQEIFEMLKSRMSLPYSVCHAACNPKQPNHFVKRFIDSADSGIDIYYQHYTLRDNVFLPTEYITNIEAEYRGTVYYSRYIEGLWTQAEGLVYPNYAAAFEETFDIAKATDWCISVDYGTQNAFAAIKWAYDGKMWHAVDEYRYSGRDEGHQKTDEDYLTDMVLFCQDVPGEVEIIVDPSAASFIAALRRCKDRTFRVRKGDNAVLDGIRDTAVCIQIGYAKIGDNCTEIRKEFEGYVWDEKADNDKPIKENDHFMDALRYMVKTKRLYRPQEEYKSPFG